MILSSMPSIRVWPFLTSTGSKLPSRSRGTAIETSPSLLLLGSMDWITDTQKIGHSQAAAQGLAIEGNHAQALPACGFSQDLTMQAEYPLNRAPSSPCRMRRIVV
jgi:hypothetical protein